MYNIGFYTDQRGKKPVREYIKALSASHDKQSRKTLDKLHEYLDVLSKGGLSVGLPYIRHIEGEIWELRPATERIFFVAWTGSQFILLHNFTKKTQKTPRNEIEIAKKRLKDLKERGQNG